MCNCLCIDLYVLFVGLPVHPHFLSFLFGFFLFVVFLFFGSIDNMYSCINFGQLHFALYLV